MWVGVWEIYEGYRQNEITTKSPTGTIGRIVIPDFRALKMQPTKRDNEENLAVNGYTGEGL